MILFRNRIPAHLFLSCDDKWRINQALAETDGRYIKALMRFEDKRFYWHLGVDPIALIRATFQNLTAGKVVSGSSTITMQVVRVLEPRPRTIASKMIEALRAVQLELRFSKKEILELYLRFAPFGRNIEGVAAASLAYFGHLPSALSFDETATLLAIPQDPTARFPQPENFERLQRATAKIARRMAGWSLFKEIGTGHPEPKIPRFLRPFPREIPHVALWLSSRYPDRSEILTTLDAGIQTVAENIFSTSAHTLQTQSIHNGSIVVVDHKSSEIRAAVGNFDFWDTAHAGQISGFDVPRSPGSTLKPVLYTLAIDRGIYLPSTLIPDVPTRFSGYTPRNFDETFAGLIKFDEALAQSRNVPFVNLLHRIGIEEFLTLLRRMGVRSLNPQPGRYGLSAIVGGLEITPLELAGIYTTLARNGTWKPLRWLVSPAGINDGQPIFSEGAAWLTRQTLSLRDRPDFPNRRSINDTSKQIHWKTGTSFGQRDAWAAGFGQNHTAVVWLGNFDNRPSAALVGAEAAAPLLFNLIEAIDHSKAQTEENPSPAQVEETEVCAFSGMPAGHACTQKRIVHALQGKTPATVCPYHIHVDIDLATERSLTQACRLGRRYETRTFVRLPHEMRKWLTDTGQNLPTPPPLAGFCKKVQTLETPKIITPVENQTLLLMAGVNPENQKVGFEAELPPDASEASWFVNGEFMGTTSGDERIWWSPEVGEHEIVLTDEVGRMARRIIRVRVP